MRETALLTRTLTLSPNPKPYPNPNPNQVRETAPKGEPAAAAVRVATPPVRAPTGGIRRGGRAVDAEGERRKRAEEAVARQVCSYCASLSPPTRGAHTFMECEKRKRAQVRPNPNPNPNPNPSLSPNPNPNPYPGLLVLRVALAADPRRAHLHGMREAQARAG